MFVIKLYTPTGNAYCARAGFCTSLINAHRYPSIASCMHQLHIRMSDLAAVGAFGFMVISSDPNAMAKVVQASRRELEGAAPGFVA